MRYPSFFLIAFFCVCLGVPAVAQDSRPVEQLPTDKSAGPPDDNAARPPRSDHVAAGESSSKQTQIDISPPPDDSKAHPEAGLGSGDGDAFTPYNPMKAMKDVEIGDFYYKQDNYRAAISRYREALEYKPHDAEATFKLAEALGKSGDAAGAATNYDEYLKILPSGPYAGKAREALKKLKMSTASK